MDGVRCWPRSRSPEQSPFCLFVSGNPSELLEQIAHGFGPTLQGRIYYEVGEYASREPTDFVIESLNHRQWTIGPGSSYCAGIIEFTPFTAIEVRAVSKPVWGLNT